MIHKKILNPQRVRRISGGFSFIPHRFVADGFLASLGPKELLLYLFLVIVSDRCGLSFYSYDRICTLLELTLDEYISARDRLITNDLIDFDGTLYQVLELPAEAMSKPKSTVRRLPRNDPASIGNIIGKVFHQDLRCDKL